MMDERILGLDIDTPALVLDLEKLESNIQRMAAFARAKGFGLRPHAKTHKSVEIGRLQMAAGALGICCAKLSEAEALAAGGLGEILITSNIVGSVKLERLFGLHHSIPGLMVVADDPRVVTDLANFKPKPDRPLPVLVDVDVGLHRSGAVGVDQAVQLAKRIAESPNLKFAGLQGYAGHVQQIAGRAERVTEASRSAEHLRAIVSALAGIGVDCPIVSGGGTGTYSIDPTFGVYTDLQVGSYVVMDVEYLDVDAPDTSTPWFEPSLFIVSQVISANQGDHVTIDAGSKSISFDGPLPRIVAPDAHLRYSLYGDEFGMLEFAPGSMSLELGDRVLMLTPHCDPTINLHSHYVCVRNATVVDRWSIQARGMST